MLNSFIFYGNPDMLIMATLSNYFLEINFLDAILYAYLQHTEFEKNSPNDNEDIHDVTMSKITCQQSFQ